MVPLFFHSALVLFSSSNINELEVVVKDIMLKGQCARGADKFKLADGMYKLKTVTPIALYYSTAKFQLSSKYFTFWRVHYPLSV
jgi:hypothetical protein